MWRPDNYRDKILKMKARPFIILFTVCCLLSTFFISCKIGYGFNGASIPPDAKTITVAYFANNAPLSSPLLSQQFTEAMRDICVTQTKLTMVEKNGDLKFEGYISSYQVAPVALQTNDAVSTSRLTVAVTVKYTNKLDEKKNFEQSFSRFADFSSAQNIASVEQELIRQINKQLTEDIFNKAFNNW